MTVPYNKQYLPYVSDTIGTMFERISNTNIDPIIFWNTFINSNVAKQIEKANPKYLTCSSIDYINEIYNYNINISTKEKIHKNKYYWAAWSLTNYQYTRGYSFYKINSFISIEEVLKLYDTLHEADITKFYLVIDSYIKKDITNLKRIRLSSSLSQSELAKLSNVKLRSIQMYEQKKNDINKAQAETLYKLSKVLGCNIIDLLEY